MERIIDTVVRTIIDSSIVKALLECDSLGRVRLSALRVQNSELQQQFFELQDNQLSVKSSAKVTERVREVIKSDTLYKYVEVAVPYPEITEVNRLRWWQRWACWIALFYVIRTALKIASNWRKITIKNLLKLL